MATSCITLDDERAESFRCTIDGGGKTGGPGSDDDEIVQRHFRMPSDASLLRNLLWRRLLKDLPIWEDDHGAIVSSDACYLQQLGSLRIRGEIHPLVWNLVSGEKIPCDVGLLRPAVADDADSLELRRMSGHPVVQHVVEHGEQALLWRIPRLDQIVIEADLIDRRDGGIGIGVGSEQRLLGIGKQPLGLDEQIDACKPRHPLIHQHQCHGFICKSQLLENIEGPVAGFRPDHPEMLPEPMANIARDGLKHLGVVINSQNDRLVGHVVPPDIRSSAHPVLRLMRGGAVTHSGVPTLDL